MNRYKSILATMLAVLSLLSFNSCSDKESDEPTDTPAAKSVAGTYKGDMTCSVMGQESVFEDMTFTVTASDDATVSVGISSFGNPPMQVPEITVPDVKVAGSDGTYSLASTKFEGELSNGKTYSGTLDGSYASDQITIRFNLQYGSMPMPMICSFTSPKQK
ncbi:MAG: calycin-like domain-containing protein [Muribaculaceae bacterium]|nr:calycin-like domain-containing protein [Lachnospiraceae bacterium]MCM1297488.1 calycin-like domain-containing protein [Muribaculaceae bacterium]